LRLILRAVLLRVGFWCFALADHLKPPGAA